MNDDAKHPEPLFQADVVSYRLGLVEQKASHMDESLEKLTVLVTRFIAEMPAKYVPRHEHELQGKRTWQVWIAVLTLVIASLGVLATALAVVTR